MSLEIYDSEVIEFWLKEFAESGSSLEDEINEVKGTIENEKCFYLGGNELSQENIALLEMYLEILESKR